MDITETRRTNLRRWAAKHGTPQGEKSLFSQLKSTGSFGEKVARRLEKQYGMGDLFLDTVQKATLDVETSGVIGEDLTGEDSPFFDAPPTRPGIGVRVGGAPATVPIRAVKLRLQAGVSGFVAEPDMDIDHGYFDVPASVIEELRLNPADLLIMSIKGRSMEPMMFEDDKVLVDTSKRTPINNECFAVNWNGEPLVKCLIKKGDSWCLYSMNRDPKYHTIDVRSGQCSIIGLVVWQPARIVTGRI